MLLDTQLVLLAWMYVQREFQMTLYYMWSHCFAVLSWTSAVSTAAQCYLQELTFHHWLMVSARLYKYSTHGSSCVIIKLLLTPCVAALLYNTPDPR